MRLLVSTDRRDCRPGYRTLTTDPADPLPPLDVRRVPSLLDFGDHALAGEAAEVVVPSAVDYVPRADVDRHLAYWGSRLAPGGRLVVTGLDLLGLAFQVDAAGLDPDEARRLLFADRGGRRAAYAAEEVRLLVEGVGLTVDRVSQGVLHYTVVASRPLEG